MARGDPFRDVSENLVGWYDTLVPRRSCRVYRSLIHGVFARHIEALEAATASLSVDAQKRAAKDAQKKAAKAEAALQKQADKLAKSVITIKRIERNKKKFVTAVSGLEAFGLDLKKVCCRRRTYLKWAPCTNTPIPRPLDCQRVWQKVCYRLFSHQNTERRGGDCRSRRCEPRNRRALVRTLQGHPAR